MGQIFLDPKIWGALIGVIALALGIWNRFLSHDANLKRLQKKIRDEEALRDYEGDKRVQEETIAVNQAIKNQDEIVKKWMQSDIKPLDYGQMDTFPIPFPTWLAITEIAQEFDLPYDLVGAVCLVESNANTYAMRYEPHWKYTYNTIQFAKDTGCTVETERISQSTSWGIMQVMGTVAREYEHVGFLSQLCELKIGLNYGCRHLQKKIKQFGVVGGISAYNAGIPKKNELGLFANQGYVDKILESQLTLKNLINSKQKN